MFATITIILSLHIYLVCGENYCDETMRCDGIENSGCNCAFGLLCIHPREHPLTNEIRESLLVAHNKYREKVASGKEKRGGIAEGVTEMYALQYDVELEHTANCWNKKCEFAHDMCRITKRFRPAGQNLYWASGRACDWNYNLGEATRTWYEEVQYMSPLCFDKFGFWCPTFKVGHFTQMVWSKTTHVGCSLVEYAGSACQLACNYGPAGNFQLEPVFERGAPASKCKFKSDRYKHLCLVSANQEDTVDVKIAARDAQNGTDSVTAEQDTGTEKTEEKEEGKKKKKKKRARSAAGVRWELDFAVPSICLVIMCSMG